MALAVSGAVLLGSLIAVAPSLFPVWLGSTPRGAVGAAQILALWQFSVLIYLPFQFLLQATGNERTVAAAVWAHTLLVFVLIPAAMIVDLDVVRVCLYWTFASLVNQAAVFCVVHRRLGLFVPTFSSRRVRAALCASGGFLAVCFVLAYSAPNASSFTVLAYLALPLVTLLAGATLIMRRPLGALLKARHHRSVGAKGTGQH